MNISTYTRNTAADPAGLQREAYNAAFYELGLRWHWDGVAYDSELEDSEQRVRLRRYLEARQPHLLKAYDADFLVEVIQATMTRYLDSATELGVTSGRRTNWAAFQHGDVGF
ncbi:MAG: hypothetical protein V4724_07125 [Pseudomonadota bacterium]